MMTRLAPVALIVACAFASSRATAQSTTPTPEIRRGFEMSGDRESRSRQFYERAIRKLEPSLKGDVSRIPLYLELFKREFVEDTRTFAVELSSHAATIRGHVEFPEHKAALTNLFKYLALEVSDEVELLPSSSLGNRRFGIVTAERTFVRSRPVAPGAATRSENLTDCVSGDLIFVLKEAEHGQLLCHAPDGYVGYVSAADVRRIDEKEFAGLNAATPVRHPERIEQVIAQAHQFLGTPYVWAGATREGCDCSGLVRASFKSAGIVMPRDADQQSLVGRLVGTRWHRASLRRGDTLFFLGRRGNISHTAIYLGDGKMIEATSPVVTISNFDVNDTDASDRGAEDRFCYAKRVIE
jgi:hypothetical protein